MQGGYPVLRLVIDIASNRVVWFTDSDTRIILTDSTALVDFQGEMPRKMTAANCWNWVLRDRKLTRLDNQKTPSLAEMNRAATEKALNRKISQLRNRYANGLPFAEMIATEKVNAANRYLADGTSHFIIARTASLYGIGMKEAAERIVREHDELVRGLLTTEAQLQEFRVKIANAKTEPEMLAVHDAIATLR